MIKFILDTGSPAQLALIPAIGLTGLIGVVVATLEAFRR